MAILSVSDSFYGCLSLEVTVVMILKTWKWFKHCSVLMNREQEGMCAFSYKCKSECVLQHSCPLTKVCQFFVKSRVSQEEIITWVFFLGWFFVCFVDCWSWVFWFFCIRFNLNWEFNEKLRWGFHILVSRILWLWLSFLCQLTFLDCWKIQIEDEKVFKFCPSVTL